MNLVLLFVNGTLIAGIYTLAKVAAQAGISAFAMLAWQLLSASVAVTVVAALSGRLPSVSAATVRYAAIAGALGITAPNLITFAALSHVPAGTVGVIGALSPVFTYGIAVVLGVERMRGVRALGIALGFAGVLALLLPRGASSGAVDPCWTALALGGPMLLAGGNLFRTLAWPRGLHPLSAASLTLALQALAVVPGAALLGELVVPSAALEAGDLALLGAGGLTTAFYLTAFELQRRAGPVIVGQLGYVITIASLLLGAVMFGERPERATVVAVLGVFAGVMLVHRTAEATPTRASLGRSAPR